MVINNRHGRIVSRCCVLLLLTIGFGCFRLTPITSYSANYPDKWFQGGVKEDRTIKFWVFASGGPEDESLADVFLRFPDQNVVRLKDLSEDTAKTWALDFSSYAVTEVQGRRNNPYTRYRIDESSSLSYRNGKLIRCIVAPKPNDASSPFKDVEIGPASDGPFVAFPISQEDLVRVFGKPDAIEKIQRQQPH
jgi:hypothetical protein